ncbi:hypothetical protein B0H13DRAFT_1891312 [Mycena leptocephala]|nr:hypothetical protein B0H13DRAFT_1891312 [Mycena leptocephala]
MTCGWGKHRGKRHGPAEEGSGGQEERRLPSNDQHVPALAAILPAKIFLSYHLAVEAKKDQKLLKDKEGCQKPREKTEKRQNTEKSRLFAPTKASSARSVNRDLNDPDEGSLRTRRKVQSHSISPKKESLSSIVNPGGESNTADSPEVTAKARSGSRTRPSLQFPIAARRPNARSGRTDPSKPLKLVTTLETAHADSPTCLTFKAMSLTPEETRYHWKPELGLNSPVWNEGFRYPPWAN